ncbi:MAG: dihydropteroate synthase [Saprospiraceae bacterium]|nr:dihydropteroate synthase [Saprospiraceae bacterium]
MKTLNCNGKVISAETPTVMGIVNLTTDSFYALSRVMQEDMLHEKVAGMLSEGATFIDVGGMSSRPGATMISPDEEIERVLPAVINLKQWFPDIIISVDTFRSKVAALCLEAGASMINDISAGLQDESMFDTVASYGVPYIMMHMRGLPSDMQLNTGYDDIMLELLSFFAARLRKARNAGIKDIIIDPGFGFGKSLEGNFIILNHLKSFGIFECPVLTGVSRKSMICKTLGVNPDQALNGTTAIHMYALSQGAQILRAHDVKEAIETIKLWEMIRNA